MIPNVMRSHLGVHNALVPFYFYTRTALCPPVPNCKDCATTRVSPCRARPVAHCAFRLCESTASGQGLRTPPPPPRHTDGSENDRGLLSAQLFEEFNANREFTSGAELGSGQGSLSGWGRALKIWPKRGKVLRLQQRGQFFSGGGARLSRIRAWTWPPPPRPQQRLRKGRRNQLFPRRSIAQGLAAAAAAAAAVPSPSGRGAGHAGGVTRGVAVLRHALRTRHALRLRTRHVLRRQRRRNACWLAQICSA